MYAMIIYYLNQSNKVPNILAFLYLSIKLTNWFLLRFKCYLFLNMIVDIFTKALYVFY